MGVFIREKNGHLYLDYRINGRRSWDALHLTIGTDERHNRDARKLAEIIRSKKELQIVSGEQGLLDPVEGKRPLVAYAELLAEKQDPKNPLPKSLRYLREYAGPIQLGAVNERWVDGYRDFLLDQKTIGKASAAKYLEAVKTVFKRAVRDLIIPRNPSENVKNIPAPEPVKEFLTHEELGKLAQTPLGGDLGEEVKRAFLFGCLTGLRISDLRSLIWGEIVRGADWQILKRKQKTGRIVAVLLNEAAIKIISESEPDLHKASELVFPRLSSSKTNTNQYLKTWARTARIEKNIGWHMARHTFATLALDKSVSPH